jgi:raffinose/stachyose/melibiose transport system permease protein
MSSRTRVLRRISGYTWVVPALALVVVFVYYPVFENFRLSLFKWNAFSPREKFIGLDNYTTLAADPIFWSSLFNNVAYAVVSVVFQVVIGVVLAAVLEEVVVARWRGFFRTIYFIPATISITVVGLLFQFLYHPQLGLIDQAVVALGHPEWAHSWLGEAATAIWAIIAMSQWQNIGYVVVLFIVAIQRIPRELYEAAYIDGASKSRAFLRITVPLLREMTVLMLIVTVSGAFLVFNEVKVMTDGGPNNASQVLGTWLYRSAFLNDDPGYASAIASVIFVITLGAAIVQLMWARRGQVEY